jgi:hypothetical protein
MRAVVWRISGFLCEHDAVPARPPAQAPSVAQTSLGALALRGMHA